MSQAVAIAVVSLLLRKGWTDERELHALYPSAARARSHLDDLVNAGTLAREGHRSIRYRVTESLLLEYEAFMKQDAELAERARALTALAARLAPLRGRVYAREPGALAEALDVVLDMLEGAGRIDRGGRERLAEEIRLAFPPNKG